MSIEVKKKICRICSTLQYIWSKGRCKKCTSIENASSPNKSKDKNNDVPKSNELAPYFIYHVAQIDKNPVCANCGCGIKASYFHVAHILPKSKYPSVKANLDNAVYLCTSILGGNGCHEMFDSNANDKWWVEDFLALDDIIRQFNKFKHLVTETGKKEFRILNEIANAS